MFIGVQEKAIDAMNPKAIDFIVFFIFSFFIAEC